MKTFIQIILAFTLIYNSSSFSQSHKLFKDILKDHVNNGLVDYKNLRADKRLDEYLNYLSSTDPASLDRTDELVFWINAYNAFTLKVIVDNYPVKSIRDIKTSGKKVETIWDEQFISISGKNYSLNDIEHKILRTEFNEPRIHFAVVCASLSCPELLNEAFEGETIDKQLNQQAIRFLSNKNRNEFNLKNRTAYLSMIFNWFKDDFGTNDGEVLLFLSKFLDNKIKDDIINNSVMWQISYKNYDWNLNETK